MQRALDLAERARGLTSPNPLVGAVVVADPNPVAAGGLAVLRAAGIDVVTGALAVRSVGDDLLIEADVPRERH